jgi:hypothetical protein
VNAKLLAGTIGSVCAVACAICTAFLTYIAVDRVNAKLPTQERFGLLWWHAGKYLRLRRVYRRLYSDGKLFGVFFSLEIAFFVCMLVAAWGFGIIGR